ncbi:MAG: hypothetical protein ABF379_10940 [Akkermansiaceae bacterium]
MLIERLGEEVLREGAVLLEELSREELLEEDPRDDELELLGEEEDDELLGV